MTRRRVLPRVLMVLLLVAIGLYLAVCVLVWAKQDGLVFPGAGRGDRGVPLLIPAATVGTVDSVAGRTRYAVVQPLPEVRVRMVLLMFGGNGEDLFAVTAGGAQLARYGAEVVAAEHPGYGASGGRPGVGSLLAAADAVAAVARARAHQAQVPLVVVGSSLGTFCATHVAAQGGVERLVLRAPPSTLAAAAQRNFAWLPAGLLLAHAFDNLTPAARVRCPALVVHGDRDGIVAPEFGRAVAGALPNGRFVEVPGCGHNNLDLSPEGPVAKELRAFLP